MRRLVATICVALAVLTSTSASPAHAEQLSFPDRAGDVAHPMDIRRVTVSTVSAGHRLVVTLRHRAVSRRDSAFSSIFVDTTPRRAGPDFYLAGLVGGVYQLYEADGWKVGPRRGCPRGDYRFSYDTRTDTTRFSLSRGCLDGVTGHPTRVRVSAFAGTSGARQDWAPSYRRYARWLPLR